MDEQFLQQLNEAGLETQPADGGTPVETPAETPAEPQNTSQPEKTPSQPEETAPSTKPDDTPSEPGAPPENESSSPGSLFESINQTFGQSFESDEQIKEVLTQFPELRSSQEEFTKQKEYHTALETALEEVGSYDPLAPFGGNEETYKRHVMQQHLLNSGVNPNIVGKAVSGDVSKMSDLDVVKMNVQFKNPDIDDETASMVAYKQLGIDIADEDFDITNVELSKVQQAELKVAAGEVRDKVNTLINSVEIPALSNPVAQLKEQIEQRKTQRQELSDKWADAGNRLAEKFTDVKVPLVDKDKELSVLEYSVGEDYKKQIPELVRQFALRNNMEPSEENVKQIEGMLQTNFVQTQAQKLLLHAWKQASSAKLQEMDQKHNNTNPLNNKENPDAKADPQDQLYADLKKQWGM